MRRKQSGRGSMENPKAVSKALMFSNGDSAWKNTALSKRNLTTIESVL